MAEQISKNSFSADDVNAAVDVFEDVPDAPKHPDDTFDPHEYLDSILAAEKEEGAH